MRDVADDRRGHAPAPVLLLLAVLVLGGPTQVSAVTLETGGERLAGKLGAVVSIEDLLNGANLSEDFLCRDAHDPHQRFLLFERLPLRAPVHTVLENGLQNRNSGLFSVGTAYEGFPSGRSNR